MSHSNTVKLYPVALISYKPIVAIKNFCKMLAEAFAEAKAMEQETRKMGGNW